MCFVCVLKINFLGLKVNYVVALVERGVKDSVGDEKLTFSSSGHFQSSTRRIFSQQPLSRARKKNDGKMTEFLMISFLHSPRVKLKYVEKIFSLVHCLQVSE